MTRDKVPLNLLLPRRYGTLWPLPRPTRSAAIMSTSTRCTASTGTRFGGTPSYPPHGTTRSACGRSTSLGAPSEPLPGTHTVSTRPCGEPRGDIAVAGHSPREPALVHVIRCRSPQHADVFLSASGDGTSKVWDVRQPGPSLSFVPHPQLAPGECRPAARGTPTAKDHCNGVPCFFPGAPPFEVLTADWCKYNDCIIATGGSCAAFCLVNIL